jgi:hypothetical protein
VGKRVVASIRSAATTWHTILARTTATVERKDSESTWEPTGLPVLGRRSAYR